MKITKKQLSRNRIKNIFVGVVIGLFVLSIFTIFWKWIGQNAVILAIVTGAILLALLIFGWVTPRKVRNKLKKRFSIGY